MADSFPGTGYPADARAAWGHAAYRPPGVGMAGYFGRSFWDCRKMTLE